MNRSYYKAQLAYDNMMPEDEQERMNREQARIAWEEEHADDHRDEELDEKRSWGGLDK